MPSLQDKLRQPQNGVPVITVELSPPKGTDISRVIQRAESLKPWVDGINIPDCQRSILKMSSLAASKLILDQTGIEPVWQLTCRDRNIIALQADLMGAWGLGITTVLALTGDPVQVGDQADVAKQVFHLDSLRLLNVVHDLNKGLDAAGHELKNGGSRFTVGSALNPFKLVSQAQQNRLKAKLERGIDFFQTQPVYDTDAVEKMLAIVHQAASDVGCPPPPVMVGIIPPKSPQMARFMNKTIIGIDIPESFIQRLEASDNPAQESIDFTIQLVQALEPINPYFHFMPVGFESKMPTILEGVWGAKGLKQEAPAVQV
jgi:methylenetetrahydrofolate reductase (NADPH)